jgi:hypothetical protein
MQCGTSVYAKMVHIEIPRVFGHCVSMCTVHSRKIWQPTGSKSANTQLRVLFPWDKLLIYFL